ncbi:hypothetical protein BD410DRAFT_789057, partial [Rickenella mellea]
PPTQLWLAPEIFTTSSHNVLRMARLAILWPLTRANPILSIKGLHAVTARDTVLSMER